MYKKIIIFLFLLILLLILFLFIFKCEKEKKFFIFKKEIKEKLEREIKEPSIRGKIVSQIQKEKINYDAFIMKIDTHGDLLWGKTFGDNYINWADFIIKTEDSGFLVTGRNYSYEERIDGIFLNKFDREGNLIKTKILNMDKNNLKEYSEFKLQDGVLTAGKTYNSDRTKPDIYITKTDIDGNFDWSKTFGNEFYEWGYYTFNGKDGSTFLLDPAERTQDGKSDICLLIKNKTGQINKIFGGDDFDCGYSLARIKSGYLITGISFSYGNGLSDIYIIRTDSQGDCIMAKSLGSTGNDEGFAALETENGDFIICGATTSYGRGGYDIYIIKTDSNGNLIWEKTYGTQYDDAAYAITEAENGFVLCGIAGENLFNP